MAVNQRPPVSRAEAATSRLPERPASTSADQPVATRGGVKSAERTLELLETCARADDWITSAEIRAITGMPRSSLHGLLQTLTASGWLEEDPAASRFRLGVRSLICGTTYLDRDRARPFAVRALEEIRAKCGYTTHIARRHDGDVLYLETREARRSLHMISRVGRLLPAHATALGKALLAELTDDEVKDIVPPKMRPLTPHTLTDRSALLDELAAVRANGYATETGENNFEVRCVAVAVPYRIPASDALSCSLPIGIVSDAETLNVANLLMEAARDLGQSLKRDGIR